MMLGFIIKRIVQSIAVLAVLLTIVFIGGRVIGDPVDAILPAEASESARQALEERLGLNHPFHVQYVNFVKGVTRGDFGVSYWQNQPALPIVLNRLPATLYLALIALGVALPLGVILGAWGALQPRRLADRMITIFNLGGVSIVDFWLALVLILFFAVRLGWFPTGGYGGGRFLVLPVIVLSFRLIGSLGQFTRSALLDEYSKLYVKMARSKGLSEVRVFGHVVKNASIPIVALSGFELASLVNGAVVVETVFAWPGLGRLIVQVINERDLPLLEATTAVTGALILAVNLAVEVTYTALDPKIRPETRLLKIPITAPRGDTLRQRRR